MSMMEKQGMMIDFMDFTLSEAGSKENRMEDFANTEWEFILLEASRYDASTRLFL